MAKNTSFRESNINNVNNTSSLTIDIWFSAQNSTTWFGSAVLYCTCNGTTKSVNVSHSKGGSVNASFTFDNIKHNEDGSKSVSWSWSCATGTGGLGTQSDSGTRALTIIPRGSKINDFNDYFNFGESLTFSITKNVASYYDVLEIGFIDDETAEFNLLETIENVEDGFIWTPSEDILNTIYNNTPTRDFRTLTFKISTFTDDSLVTQIGDTNTNSNVGMIVNAEPTFTSFKYQDVNEKTIALTGDSSKVVKGHSTLRISDLVVNANKGAYLQLIQINDNQYTYSEDFTIDLEKWASNKITIYVIDSRNNSTKLELLIGINFINYIEKTITSKSCLREGSINEESILSFSGTFFNSSFGAVENVLTARYRYKETGYEDWIDGNTEIVLDINDNNFYFEDYIKGDTDTGFSADKSYDIQIIINDLLSDRAITLILAVGEPSIDIYKSNVAFGGIYDDTTSEFQAQFKKAVNFEGEIYINGVKMGGGEFATGGEALPIGSMIPYGSDTNIPSNWRICDGAEISRETYADLFNIIGTSYGEGDGVTTFNLPNKRGRVSVGLDTEQEEFNEIGLKGGSKYLQKHSHIYERSPLYYAEQNGNSNAVGEKSSLTNNVVVSTHNAGEGDSGNLQPYEIDVWIIKVSNLVSSLEETTGTIIDNLTSTSTTDGLSANMGRELNEKINNFLKPKLLGAGPYTTSGTLNDDITNYNYIMFEGWFDNNECMTCIINMETFILNKVYYSNLTLDAYSRRNGIKFTSNTTFVVNRDNTGSSIKNIYGIGRK